MSDNQERVTFVLAGPVVYCQRCDERREISVPISVDAFALAVLNFARVHEGKECPAYD